MWKANGKTTTLQLSWTVSLQKHSVWKRLWTCRETEMNYYIISEIKIFKEVYGTVTEQDVWRTRIEQELAE
jgi:hypothetical protein